MILSAAYLARMAFSQGVSPCIVAHPLSPRATTAAIITRFIIASLLLLEFTIRPALGQTGERFDSFDLLTQLIHNRDRSLGNLIHSQLARDSIRGIQPNQLANLANKPKPTCRSEEHTSELQSLMRISYAVFCLKKKKKQNKTH